MATVPDPVAGHGGGGIFVSLTDIYREQMGQGRALQDMAKDVSDLAGDVSKLQDDVEQIKSRQWPPLATSILGGSVVAVLGAVVAAVLAVTMN